ncbi:hypothetical protein NKDENANG_00638 [Candidatus Entotheonellaceae bacterium PAL068K]
MLCQVIAIEADLVSIFQELLALLVEVGQHHGFIPVYPVENAEPQGYRVLLRCGMVVHRFMASIDRHGPLLAPHRPAIVRLRPCHIVPASLLIPRLEG